MVYLIRRFASFYVDGIIVMLMVYFIYTSFFLYCGIEIWDIEMPSGQLMLLSQVIDLYFYFAFFEFLFKRTIGKMIFKFRIIGYHNERGFKRFLQVQKRTLVRLFPFDPISVFFNEEYKTWHDLVSNTKVIDVRKLIKNKNGMNYTEQYGK